MGDISEISTQVAQFLAPFLPYFLKGAKLAGQEAAKKLGEKFSEESFEKAKALWERLSRKKDVQSAGQAVAALPDNQAIQAGLAQEIARALQENENLAKEILHLWALGHPDGKTVIASGPRSVAAGGKNSGVIITGDHNKVEK